jgi:hypothetical protein
MGDHVANKDYIDDFVVSISLSRPGNETYSFEKKSKANDSASSKNPRKVVSYSLPNN